MKKKRATDIQTNNQTNKQKMGNGAYATASCTSGFFFLIALGRSWPICRRKDEREKDRSDTLAVLQTPFNSTVTISIIFIDSVAIKLMPWPVSHINCHSSLTDMPCILHHHNITAIDLPQSREPHEKKIAPSLPRSFLSKMLSSPPLPSARRWIELPPDFRCLHLLRCW